MELGSFSVSLAVRDLETSKRFYELLGFEVIGGDVEQHYLILHNADAVIGLFEGMFEQNILTFNPGLSRETLGRTEDDFTDVREIQRRLHEAGLELEVECDEESTGPAHIALVDPDGNPVLIDQFW